MIGMCLIAKYMVNSGSQIPCLIKREMQIALQPNLQQILYTKLGVYIHNLVRIGLFSKKSYNKKWMDPSLPARD